MKRFFQILMAAALPLAGPSANTLHAASPESFGLLVMAHGGSPEWNRTVLQAVEPLRGSYPVEVAFGMADACSLQEGVRALEAKGVRKVGVVRLFVSGESWYERTEQILGLTGGAPPAKAEDCGGGEHAAHHGGHSMALFRIATSSAFALSAQGLKDASEIGPILADRAVRLSRTPEKEDVLVLAHGPGDDAENERWIASLNARADEIRKARPFHRVEVMTLREDWPEKRQAAEQRVRDFVAKAASEGRKAIVIPFRLSGFGPYAEVLKGLAYESDGQGLLPHVNVTQWIANQAELLRASSFRGQP